MAAREPLALGATARPRTWDEFREGWRRFERRAASSTSGTGAALVDAPPAAAVEPWCADWVYLPGISWTHAASLLRHPAADVRRPLVRAAAASLARDPRWVRHLPVHDGYILASFYSASLELGDAALTEALLTHASSGAGGGTLLARLVSVDIIHASAFLGEAESRDRRRRLMRHAEAVLGPTDLLRGTAEALAHDVVSYVPLAKHGTVRDALLRCLARWAEGARAARTRSPISQAARVTTTHARTPAAPAARPVPPRTRSHGQPGALFP
jgi:hypothetical protein